MIASLEAGVLLGMGLAVIFLGMIAFTLYKSGRGK
jgi:hypothetical protein